MSDMPTNTTGPTLHALVRNQRLSPICDNVDGVVRAAVERALFNMQDHLVDVARRACVEAYTAGAVDGFQQGCLAESASYQEAPDVE